MILEKIKTLQNIYRCCLNALGLMILLNMMTPLSLDLELNLVSAESEESQDLEH